MNIREFVGVYSFVEKGVCLIEKDEKIKYELGRKKGDWDFCFYFIFRVGRELESLVEENC